MADEELRLVATFQDKISPQIKAVAARLRDFAKEVKGGAVEGEKVTKKHSEAFKSLARSVKEAADITRESFLPSLERVALSTTEAGIGLGSIAAAIGLAATAAAGFVNQAWQLKRTGVLAGMPEGAVRFWDQVGERIGIAREQMEGGLSTFNDLMQLMERRPELFRQRFAVLPGSNFQELGQLMQSLRNLPRTEQLRAALEYISKIRDVSQRKIALGLIGAPEAFAATQLEDLEKAMTDAKANLIDWTAAQQKAAEQAQAAWFNLRQTMENLQIWTGATFVPQFNEAIRGLTAYLDQHKTEIQADIVAIKDAFVTNTPLIRDAIKDAIGDLQVLVDWLNKAVEAENAMGKWAKEHVYNPLPDQPSPKSTSQTDLWDWIKKSLKLDFNWLTLIPRLWHRAQPEIILPKTYPGGRSQIIEPDLQRRREQFEKLNPQGELFHKSAFTVVGGEDLRTAGVGKSMGDAIAAMSEAVRRGALAALQDYFGPSPQGMRGGIMNASFGGAAGGGAGGGGWAGRFRGMGAGKNEGQFTPGDIGTPGSLTKLITEASRAAGIDPRIMEGIRAGESAHGSRYDAKDDTSESSWGPFQLNRRRGLGVQFEAETAEIRKKLGLGDLRDPRTIELQAQWVAQWIAKHRTTSPWMGFHGLRDADPRWGESGYDPNVLAKIKDAAKSVAAQPEHPHSLKNIAPSSQLFPLPPDEQKARDAFKRALDSGAHDAPGRLIDSAKRAGVVQTPASVHKVSGEASLNIKLASGLVPDGGVRNKGSLFKEIRLDRSAMPFASTTT